MLRTETTKIVDNLISTYETTDPETIAKDLGAYVLDVPLKGVNGFYWKKDGDDFIFLSDTLTEEERIIVLAHELGHMVLHSDGDDVLFLSNSFKKLLTDIHELEANNFAIGLLQYSNLNLSQDIPLLNWYPGDTVNIDTIVAVGHFVTSLEETEELETYLFG